MSLDPLSVVTPARIKVLLVPIGSIRQSKFTGFVDRLQHVNVVRLGDVSPDNRPNRTVFSPLAFPEGLVLYDLSTSLPPPSHLALAPFEVYREPFIVLGIADGMNLQCGSVLGHPSEQDQGRYSSNRNNGTEALTRNLADLSREFPRALVHQILVFDHDGLPLPQGIYPVPSPAKSRTTTVKTVMCDMTSRLLAEMTPYAKSLQSFSSLDSPRVSTKATSNGPASALPAHMGALSRDGSAVRSSRSASPAAERSHSTHRTSMPARMTSSVETRPSTPGIRAASPPNGRNTPSPTINGAITAKSPPRGPDVERTRAESRDRVFVNGSGVGNFGERERNKGKGRIGVVVGAMYLLAGQWPDAVKELTQSATIARASSDYLWHAKALDYLLVCLLMYAWAGMDFRIPDVFYPGSERPGSSSSKSSRHGQSNSLPDLGASTSLDPANRTASLQSLVALLPDLTNSILNLYARAWTFTDDKLPPLAFSQSAIRFAKLLSVIHLSSGRLSDHVLGHLVLNKDISPSKISRKETTVFGTSTEIITLLFRAYPQPFSEPSLSIGDRITILAGIVSVLSELGFYRKKALILKEIMAALLPALVQARKDGAAEMGVHPAASLASLNTTVKSVPVDKAGVAFDESEQGIHHFLSLVCRAYGVFLQEALGDGKNDESATHGLLGTQSSSKNAQLTAIRRVLHDASNKASGAQDLKIDILRSCINMCEALPDLGGVLWYSAQLLRTAGSGIAPGPDSSDGSPDLPIEEQIRLATNISRTLSAAKHLGIRHLEAEYWDEFLVREIEVVDTSYSSLVAHAKSEIEIAEFTEAEEEKNPFIYNPFLKVKASIAAEPLLVAHEQAFFRVTLQNLFDFDINIERIALVSDVLAFNSLPQATMIGPYRTQTILLSGTPQSSGTLSISGCTVKIKGCRERNFAIFNEPWALKPDVKGRHVGLPFEGRPVSIASDSGKGKTVRPPKGPTATTLTLSVTSAQPIITLKSISLPQSAIMILEGETQVFSVTLQNTSETIPVDLLLLSFSDSTASRMQSTLSNKELVPVELYELELAAERTQSFRWHRKHVQRDIFIRPGEEATFEIEVLGRPGLSWGKIEVDYGHLGIPKAEVKDRFYTRQLVIPLTVTVNASVDLMRNDVVSFSSSIALQHHQTADKANGVVSKDPAGSEPSSTQDHYHLSLLERISLFSPSSPCCLFLLDLRNSWPSTLTVFIEVHLPPSLSAAASSATDKVALYKHSQILHPGTTHRSPLPISRLYHPDPHAPIPTLNAANKRQFVVSAINSAPQAERCMREAFWYREALLGQVKATWREESTGRTGDVELRGLRLTPRMISALKLEDLAISMSVSLNEPDPAGGNEDERVKQVSTSRFSVPTSSFLSLSTTLHNRSTTPIHPLLRLQPALANQPRNIALDLGKKLLVDGVLQRALPVLEPGGTRTVETGFCVLARGTYEWGASVEEVRARGNVTGHGNIEGVGGRGRARTGELAGLDDGGRRTWVAEENCVVVADNQ